MNKTISANVGGFVFNIEEGAYETLSQYLKAIRKSIGADESIDEIMQDVEHRIAELMKEILQREHKEVIDANNIREIISIMGEPEVYAGEDSKSESQEKKQENYSAKADKQFYRDPDDKMLGGVCSGVSQYFGWDPLFLRILFVVLFLGFGTGLLLYIILWIIIPQAKTTSEKLRMRGEKVDVETIKQRFNEFKKDVENLSTPENQKKMRESTAKFGDAVGELAMNFYHIFGRALGVFLLILGIIFMVWLIRATISSAFIFSISDEGISNIDFNQFGVSFFGSDLRSNLVFISIIAFCLMPIVGIILAGVRLLFKTKMKFKVVGAIMGVFTTAAIATLGIIGVQTGMDFSSENHQEENSIVAQHSDTLIIQSNHDEFFSDHFKGHHEAFFELTKFTEKQIVYGFPMLDIERSIDTNFHVRIIREARGSSQTKAIERANHIQYHYTVIDNKVMFDPWFSVPSSDLIRAQSIRVKIEVPIGKYIYLDPSSDRINYDIQNIYDMEDEKMVGKLWMMKAGGLELAGQP